MTSPMSMPESVIMITVRGISMPARIGPPAVRAYRVSRPVGTAILTSYGISHEFHCLGEGGDHGPASVLEPLAPALPWLFAWSPLASMRALQSLVESSTRGEQHSPR